MSIDTHIQKRKGKKNEKQKQGKEEGRTFFTAAPLVFLFVCCCSRPEIIFRTDEKVTHHVSNFPQVKQRNAQHLANDEDKASTRDFQHWNHPKRAKVVALEEALQQPQQHTATLARVRKKGLERAFGGRNAWCG